MKLRASSIVLGIAVFLLSACKGTAQLPDFNNPIGGPNHQVITQSDMVAGLKEALNLGVREAASKASKEGMFMNDLELKIPFPPEAKNVENKMRQLGLDRQADTFVETLNSAAGEASKKAAPIMTEAIAGMSIEDAQGILTSDNHEAATEYLEQQTREQLYQAFKPEVKKAIETVGLTSAWEPIANKYNSLPFTEEVQPDLDDYVTQKTLDGLFLLVAREEKKIREHPEAQVTDLLKKVFGNL